MSVWLEIHCDVRLPGSNPKDINRPRCWTDENLNPSGHTTNQQASVLAALRSIGERAKRGGWEQRGGQWICPGCRGVKEPES